MQLINITKSVMITPNAEICWLKFLGLMFSKPKTLIFIFRKEKRFPLHMMFVFYPIDVIFLDKDKKVVEIKHNFQPFGYYNPQNKAMFIIELPKGNHEIEIGDELGWFVHDNLL